MKILATIVLSLIAITASLVCILSSICAFNGGFLNSGNRSFYVVWALVSLIIVIAAMTAITSVNRKPPSK